MKGAPLSLHIHVAFHSWIQIESLIRLKKRAEEFLENDFITTTTVPVDVFCALGWITIFITVLNLKH